MLAAKYWDQTISSICHNETIYYICTTLSVYRKALFLIFSAKIKTTTKQN